MADLPEQAIRFRTLHRSALVRIGEYCCEACKGGPGPEEGSEADSLVLMRRGSFCRHFGRRSVVADVNQAALFGAGSSYRVSHPGDGGDRGTRFEVPRRILDEFIREWDPDRAGRPLPFAASPCDAGIYWRHRELVRLLEPGAGPPAPFQVDAAALQLYADALGAGFARLGLARRSRRQATAEDHLELVEAGKRHLADHLGERLTLDDLARALHTSPFHFARIFQETAGTPLHRYLTLLRLRTALERVAEGHPDFAALALDLGFASHSHFTDAFRQEFGLAPSQWRRAASAGRLAQLSKNPEAGRPADA
jgi:AraC-like DNA-binding protein